jgi:hypothetical protein
MLKLFRPDKKTPLTRLHLIKEGEQPVIDVVYMDLTAMLIRPGVLTAIHLGPHGS